MIVLQTALLLTLTPAFMCGLPLSCDKNHYRSHVDYECYPCSPCVTGQSIEQAECKDKWGLPPRESCNPVLPIPESPKSSTTSTTTTTPKTTTTTSPTPVTSPTTKTSTMMQSSRTSSTTTTTAHPQMSGTPYYVHLIWGLGLLVVMGVFLTLKFRRPFRKQMKKLCRRECVEEGSPDESQTLNDDLGIEMRPIENTETHPGRVIKGSDGDTVQDVVED